MIQLTEALWIGNSGDSYNHRFADCGASGVLNVAQDLRGRCSWPDVEYMQVGLIDGPGNEVVGYCAAIMALVALSRRHEAVAVYDHDGGRALAVAMMYLNLTEGQRRDNPVSWWSRWLTWEERLGKIAERRQGAAPATACGARGGVRADTVRCTGGAAVNSKKIVVAIPHSHTFFWTQTCLASLKRNPPLADGYYVEIVVVDNSADWSPAIKGLTETELGEDVIVFPNYKTNKFHASALDCIVEKFDFNLLMALETDVLALRPTWLQWFVDQLRPNDYAVGHWHHERYINPSCTLYRGSVLRDMLEWCRPGSLYKSHAPQDELRWGENFSKADPLDANLKLNENPAAILKDMKSWIGGPFAEKRGWTEGTVLKEKPSGQEKGAGWYEPGQQLHHWAIEKWFNYTVCPTLTTMVNNVPVQTLYGTSMPDPQRQLEANELFGNAETVHLWGGTRALDILKHPVTCQFVKAHTPGWLAREARFWKAIVPPDVRAQTLDLICRYGWFITGQGNTIDGGSQRDKEAAEYVKQCYEIGGVTW